MQDSIMNATMYKKIMQINDQEEVNKKEKKEKEKTTVKQKDNTKTYPLKIKDYPFGSLEVSLVVFPFGMENPLKIRTISKLGDIHFVFPKQLPEISEEIKESESSKLWYTVFSQCDNASTMVAEKDNIFSFDTGALSLWTNNSRYVGVVFKVSDEDLMPWIEDPAYMEPILGSYFELIYVTSPFKHKVDCNETRMMDDGDANITYQYNLNLKAGFNCIQYKIENIHKTDPNVMASFPDKVSVTNVLGIPNCKWIGKYF